MEEIVLLNKEELDKVSGGAIGTGDRGGKKEVYCPKCQHRMSLIKIRKGPHGEHIYTFQCSECGYETVHK